MTTHAASDLVGRRCVVTGASTGIGRAARGAAGPPLLRRSPRPRRRWPCAISAAARMRWRAIRGGDRPRGRDGGGGPREPEVDPRVCPRPDRAPPAARRACNNAGICSEPRKVAPDGMELIWATNVLSYLLATEQLVPQPQAAGAPHRQRRLAARGRARPHRRPVPATPVLRPRRLRAEQAGRPHAELGARGEAGEGRGVERERDAPGSVATETFGKGGASSASSARSTRSSARAGPRRAPTPSSGSRRARTSRAAAASSGSTARSAAAASATRPARRPCGPFARR